MSVRKLSAVLLLAAATACGAEAVLGPLIILTNTWHELNNDDHTFSITDNTNGVASREGTFTGNETDPVTFDEYPFTGFWTREGDVEFTVQRPGGAVRYTGQLTSNLNRMDLSSSAGHLVLVR
jgi:hypothetical protein